MGAFRGVDGAADGEMDRSRAGFAPEGLEDADERAGRLVEDNGGTVGERLGGDARADVGDVAVREVELDANDERDGGMRGGGERARVEGEGGAQLGRARAAVGAKDRACPRRDVDDVRVALSREERGASCAVGRRDLTRAAVRRGEARSVSAVEMRAARTERDSRDAREIFAVDDRPAALAHEALARREDDLLRGGDLAECARWDALARREIERLPFSALAVRARAAGEVCATTAIRVGRSRRDACAVEEHRAVRAAARSSASGLGEPWACVARRAGSGRRAEGPRRRQCAPHRLARYPVLSRSAMLALHTDGTAEFDAALARIANRGEEDFTRVETIVREILAAVRAEGDAAVHRYTERFDKRRPSESRGALVRRDYGGAAALARLPIEARYALDLAATRIRAFHERELDVGFQYGDQGIMLGVRVLPVARAGVYAPGGKARYPSSVLMSAIPAQVAGVPEILLATPLAGDATDDAIYAAAHLSGVTAIFDAGGAQAIAAMAYGTQSVPRVDKIVGPGNVYVACAKRLVFGQVSIDGIAGPSEILVVADDEADPQLVAADLLSQAEHDEAAYPLLVCSSDLMANAVRREIEAQLATLPREAIARASLEANGHAFIVASRDLERMGIVADTIAAEHLSLHVEDPEAMLTRVRRAGAAFLGAMTPEAAGDYVAGPSHVLPTGGSVRFGSPLGVYDFVTRTSLIQYSQPALAEHAKAITTFARLEGLEAHARAVEARVHRAK